MTNAELAILGLIREASRHGYEIERVIEERGMRDWTEVAFSSIYYLTRKLENKGFIDSQIEKRAGKGPARKIYNITEKGRDAWSLSTLQALSMPVVSSDSFLIGLLGLHDLPAMDAIAALGRYQRALRQHREDIQSKQRELGDDSSVFLQDILDFNLSILNTRIQWIDQFISKLNQLPDEDGQYRLPF